MDQPLKWMTLKLTDTYTPPSRWKCQKRGV